MVLIKLFAESVSSYLTKEVAEELKIRKSVAYVGCWDLQSGCPSELVVMLAN